MVLYDGQYMELYNDDGNIDYGAVEKVFQNKEDANAYAKELELNTLGTDYSVTEMKIE